jgi:hypothetical protein
VLVAQSAEEARALALRPGFQDDGGVVVEGRAAAVVGAEGRVTSLRERPGRIEAAVETDLASVLLVRDAYSAGWSASVDGRPAALLRANGRHCAVAVPSGRSLVRLDYTPPRLGAGLWVAAGALLVLAGLQARNLQRTG